MIVSKNSQNIQLEDLLSFTLYQYITCCLKRSMYEKVIPQLQQRTQMSDPLKNLLQSSQPYYFILANNTSTNPFLSFSSFVPLYN